MKNLQLLALAAFAALLAPASFAGAIVVQPVADFIGYNDGGTGYRTFSYNSGGTTDTVWAEHSVRGDAFSGRPRLADVLLTELAQMHTVNFTWRCQWLPSYVGETPATTPYYLQFDWRGSYGVSVSGQVSGSGSASADTGSGAYWFPLQGIINTTATSMTGPMHANDDSGGLVTLNQNLTTGVVFNQQPDGRWVGTGVYLYGGTSYIDGQAQISSSPVPTWGEATVMHTHYLEAEVNDVTGPNVASWTHGSVAPY